MIIIYGEGDVNSDIYEYLSIPLAEKVASSCDRQRECNIFVNIAKKIPLFTNAESVVACFEALLPA